MASRIKNPRIRKAIETVRKNLEETNTRLREAMFEDLEARKNPNDKNNKPKQESD